MRSVSSRGVAGFSPQKGVWRKLLEVPTRGKAFPHNLLDRNLHCRYDVRVMSQWIHLMNERNSEKGRVPVTLRIPETILREIDDRVERGDLPVSRNHWIVEALIEKLKKNHNGK